MKIISVEVIEEKPQKEKNNSASKLRVKHMVRQVKLAILLAYLTAVLVKQACAHSSMPLL